MEYKFKVGDRVMGTEYALSHRVGKFGSVTRPQGKSSVFVLWDGENEDYFVHKNEIVRIEEEPMYNVTHEPKLWRDMAPEEKSALLLARYEGETIQWNDRADETVDWGKWEDCDDDCLWNGVFDGEGFAYRIKPEPKRETVTAKLCITSCGKSFHMEPHFLRGHYGDDFYFTLTFDIIDGKPDPSSIKIEEV